MNAFGLLFFIFYLMSCILGSHHSDDTKKKEDIIDINVFGEKITAVLLVL